MLKKPNLINITKQECLRCGHKWFPRQVGRPMVCPGCHSPYWANTSKKDRGEVKK